MDNDEFHSAMIVLSGGAASNIFFGFRKPRLASPRSHGSEFRTMADFFQTGAIATLHRLGKQDVMRLERELGQFAQETHIGLVLPCHVKELGTPALRQVMRELRHVSYLRQVVVGIDGANGREWMRARRIFRVLRTQRSLRTIGNIRPERFC